MSDLRTTVSSSLRSYISFLLKTTPRLNDTETDGPPYLFDPPEGGWPEVNAETLATLQKSPTVIEILSHLPRLEDPDMKGHDVVAPGATRLIDWGGGDAKWALEKARTRKTALQGLLEPVGAGEIPPHVVALTYGGNESSWWLLDTEEGTITDFTPADRPEREEPNAESPDYWRAYRTLPIHAFFEDLKQKFIDLEWVVIPENLDDGIGFVHEPKTDEARNVHRKHGWPADFKRQECREELLALDKLPLEHWLSLYPPKPDLN